MITEKPIAVFATDLFRVNSVADEGSQPVPPDGRDLADFIVAGVRDEAAVLRGPVADDSLRLWAFVIGVTGAEYWVHVQCLPGQTRMPSGSPLPQGHAAWSVSVSKKGWRAALKEALSAHRPSSETACALLHTTFVREPRLHELCWLSESAFQSWIRLGISPGA